MLGSAALTGPLVLGPKSAEKPRNHGLASKSYFKIKAVASEFPAFLPKEVENIQDSYARELASRIERVPVHLSSSNNCIMSSCVKPKRQLNSTPIVLLHGFDSSCLEWRYTFPLLEDIDLEPWAIDVLGWGFSDLEALPSCNVNSKRDHLYQFWKSYIRRPMILIGPSLGAAVAIDFTVKYPEAVDKLILIDASVYAEGTGELSRLPKPVAYAGGCLSQIHISTGLPFGEFTTAPIWLAFNGLPWDTCVEWTNIGRLHCRFPWWADATVDFMISGGYNVIAGIKKVKQKTLVIWGENDQIIDYKQAVRLHCELPNAIIRQVSNCGHIPHVEKPDAVSKLIAEFVRGESKLGSKEFILL